MKAVILAGGKGTRLYPFTQSIPKCLMEIGKRPLIEHQILLLKKNGISEIFVLAGFLGDRIKDYLENGERWGVKIECLVEKTPLGTAGALKTLEGKVKEDFLVLSGDVMLDINIREFTEHYQQKNERIASLIVHPTDHPKDSDLVEIDETNKITNLLIRPHKKDRVLPNLSIASVFIFSPQIFRYIKENERSDIEKNILPQVLKSKDRIYAYETLDYIKDMGTRDRLKKVRRDWASGEIKRILT